MASLGFVSPAALDWVAGFLRFTTENLQQIQTPGTQKKYVAIIVYAYNLYLI
jgi:hypothetical protein